MEIPDNINVVSVAPVYRVPTADEVRDAQEEQFGDFNKLIERDSSYILSDEGLLVVLQKDNIRVVVPTSLQDMVLDWARGSRVIGHYRVRRTILRILNRFWWPCLKKSVTKKLAECMSCDIIKTGRPEKQGKLENYHPNRRWGD